MQERWITAGDGWRLSVLDLPADGGVATGVAIVGHAMMVDRRTVYRERGPSLADTLRRAGFRVLVPDLRGHGRSGPTAAEGGNWSYDQLVADVPGYFDLAQQLAPGRPVFALGNSLFAHVALAYLSTRPDATIAGLVGFAMNIWNRRWTARRRRYAVKLALTAASVPIVRALGRVPCRRLRLGSMDEPADYWRCMVETTTSNRWRADDGADYAAGLGDVRCPVLHVLSDGDRLLSHPDDALMFTSTLRDRDVLRLGERCDDPNLAGIVPGHVEVVSNPSCEPVWEYVARWMTRRASG